MNFIQAVAVKYRDNGEKVKLLPMCHLVHLKHLIDILLTNLLREPSHQSLLELWDHVLVLKLMNHAHEHLVSVHGHLLEAKPPRLAHIAEPIIVP